MPRSVVEVAILSSGDQRRAGNLRDGDAVRRAVCQLGVFLAGWAHYIAFDLFVERWIWEDAMARGRLARLALVLTWRAGLRQRWGDLTAVPGLAAVRLIDLAEFDPVMGGTPNPPQGSLLYASSAIDFADASAPHAEVQKHARRAPWAEDFFFARFRPLASSGSWEGRDPLREIAAEAQSAR